MHYWCMYPLSIVVGGDINHGSANESQIIAVVWPYVKSFSDGAYDIKKWDILFYLQENNSRLVVVHQMVFFLS